MHSPDRPQSCVHLWLRRFAAAMLCFTSVALHAQTMTPRQFTGFTLDYLNVRTDHGITGLGSFSAPGTDGLATALSLDGLAQAGYLNSSDGWTSLDYMLSFGLTANPGYRIARIEFIGFALGNLAPAVIPTGPGIWVFDDGADVMNAVRAGAEALPHNAPMPDTLSPDVTVLMIDGEETTRFTIDVNPEGALRQQLQLALNMQLEVGADLARWCEDYPACATIKTAPSQAFVMLDRAYLMIYTESALPVPEPHAWLMLLLGLLPLGLRPLRALAR